MITDSMAARPLLQNTSSKTHEIVKGILQIPYKSKNNAVHGSVSDTSDEEEEFDDISLYFGNANNFVSSKVPKEVEVVIKSENGRSHKCTGKFPLTQMFWQVEALVDSRGFLKQPPAYTIIKDAEIVRQTNLVTIFLSECMSIMKGEEEKVNAVKACFEAFCRITGEDKNLNFANLENILTQYLNLEKSGCCLGKITNTQFGNHPQEDHSLYIVRYVMGSELGSTVLLSASYPKLVRTCSQLLPYTFLPFLSQLRSVSMSNTVNPTKTIELADEMARERPWEYAFKDILASKLKVYGTETKRQLYEQAGYLAMTPQTEKDAIYIYDYLKDDSKRNGNMCIGLNIIRNRKLLEKYSISSTKRLLDALEYLENNNVIKCEEFNSDRHIFLRHNWQAEVDTAEGLDTILKRYKEDPLVWDIDLQSPEFATIRKDPDQLRASQLICHLPVTVLSGRGGCGKTTVVTKLLQHLCVKEEARLKEEREKEELETLHIVCESTFCLNDTCEISGTTNEISGTTNEISGTTNGITQEVSKCEDGLDSQNNCNISDVNKLHSKISKTEELPCNSTLTGTYSQKDVSKTEKMRKDLVSDLIKILENSRQDDCLELKEFKSRILLTAPTGKAARLLGCKAKLPSATLHSVIMSWRMYSKKKNIDPDLDKPWNYAGVEVLVVDECSLVPVRLFATVINILLKEADLQKIILLGDVRQLPSIEPGEFLKDVFETLPRCRDSEFGLSIELRHNHRSESALIVDNARKISSQMMPTFDPAQRFYLVETSDNADDGEQDQMIRELLKNKQEVMSDVDSQFVSFRNAHCKAVNELCCLHYNGHSIMTSQTSQRKVCFDFQIGDKICLGKNNLVTNSRRHVIDKYLKDDPEFQKAFKEAQQKRERQEKRSVCTTSQSLSRLKLNKTVLDDTSALSLILGEDETFNTTIDKIREDDLRVEGNRAELEKIERRKRAEKKKAEWTEKSLQRVADESLIGESNEKLCNGEVFFIMDEFNEVDKNGKHIKYFVLSDRDPELPRVVCVPFKQLRRNCQMKHSWARTIHTYQGSESRTIVYVLGKAIPQNWQHVYTAITRGKNSVYIVGSHAQLLTAISQREQTRFSQLSTRLKEVLVQNWECIEMCKQKFVSSFPPQSTIDFCFDSEQWSDDSMLLQIVEEVEADVSRCKDEKKAAADANLWMTQCNFKDNLNCKSHSIQSDDQNTKVSEDVINVNIGICSDSTQDKYEDDAEHELMAKIFKKTSLDSSAHHIELSQCGLQQSKGKGKFSINAQLSSSANQIISNAPEYESSDSVDEYRIIESISKSSSRQIKNLCTPDNLYGPSRLNLSPKRLFLKSSTDFSLSPKHEVSRPCLNVTPPCSSSISTQGNTSVTSPPKKLCVDTPFRDSFTSLMTLHDDEAKDDDESPLPRKTPTVCRKL